MHADPLWPTSFVIYFDFEPALDELLCCPKRLYVWLVLPVAPLVWLEWQHWFPPPPPLILFINFPPTVTGR